MEIVPLSALRDNYIWALVRGTRCAVVDPGDAAPVEAFLAQRGLLLDAILITHHHVDHVGGIAALVARHPVPVYGPAGEAIAGLSHRLREGDCVSLDGGGMNIALQVIEVPGHTAGHIAYLGTTVMFCGDTLFSAGCGRLFEGTPAQMHASLARLAARPAASLVCCTHEYTLSNLHFAAAVEPDNAAVAAHIAQCEALRAADKPTLPTTVARERGINPFLRCDQPAVRAAAERHAGRPLSDEVAVFAALRAWKNDFR